MHDLIRSGPCPIGLPRGAEALGTATTVMRRAALLPIRVRRRDRQDKLSRKIIAHAVGTTYFKPDIDTIFEIGGQDAKYAMLKNRVLSANTSVICGVNTCPNMRV